eukprot:UN1686
MQRTDPSTSRSRGYAILQRADVCARGMFALKATNQPWKTLDSWLTTELPALISTVQPTAETEVWVFSRALPAAVASLVSETRPGTGATIFSDVGNVDLHAMVIEALRKTAVYQTLDAASLARPNEAIPASKESLALLILLLGRMDLLGEVSQDKQSADMLEEELQFLHMQAENLLADSRSGRGCCDRGSCKPCSL